MADLTRNELLETLANAMVELQDLKNHIDYQETLLDGYVKLVTKLEAEKKDLEITNGQLKGEIHQLTHIHEDSCKESSIKELNLRADVCSARLDVSMWKQKYDQLQASYDALMDLKFSNDANFLF